MYLFIYLCPRFSIWVAWVCPKMFQCHPISTVRSRISSIHTGLVMRALCLGGFADLGSHPSIGHH